MNGHETNSHDSYISKKRAYITLAALMLMVVLLIGSVTLYVSASNEQAIIPAVSVQDRLVSYLGSAKPYGVFTNDLTVLADLQSNFATNRLHLMGQYVGSDLSNNPGTIYFKDVVGSDQNKFLLLREQAANHIVSGIPFTKNGDYSILFENKVEANYSNCKDVQFIYDKSGDFLNIDAGLKYVSTKFNEILNKQTTDDITINLSDQNNALIDIRNSKYDTCYVTLSAVDYKKIQPGGLKIYKNVNQILIINVIDSITNEFKINRYVINGFGSGDSAANPYADSIIWNLCTKTGKVEVQNSCGIIIAPNAEVEITGTSIGRIICNALSNKGGELHFVAQDVPKETQTDSEPNKETTTVVQETTTVEDTTPVEETTPSKYEETTTVEETTSSRNEESTTVKEETTPPRQEETTTVEETTSIEETTLSQHEETTTEEETTPTRQEDTTSEEETTVPIVTKNSQDPSTMVEPTTSHNTSGDVQTSDHSKLMLSVILLLLSISMLIFILLYLYKERKSTN